MAMSLKLLAPPQPGCPPDPVADGVISRLSRVFWAEVSPRPCQDQGGRGRGGAKQEAGWPGCHVPGRGWGRRQSQHGPDICWAGWARATVDTGCTGAWPAGLEGSAGCWTCHKWTGRRSQHRKAAPHLTITSLSPHRLGIQDHSLWDPAWRRLASTHKPSCVLPQGLCTGHFLCQLHHHSSV